MSARVVAAALLAFGAGACASTDYLDGGNLIETTTVFNQHGVRVDREYLEFSTFPGLPDEHRMRWAAYNSGSSPRCLTVRLTNIRGGGYQYGQIYLMPPTGERFVVAYAQNALGHELTGTSNIYTWAPSNGDCVANAPT